MAKFVQNNCPCFSCSGRHILCLFYSIQLIYMSKFCYDTKECAFIYIFFLLLHLLLISAVQVMNSSVVLFKYLLPVSFFREMTLEHYQLASRWVWLLRISLPAGRPGRGAIHAWSNPPWHYSGDFRWFNYEGSSWYILLSFNLGTNKMK